MVHTFCCLGRRFVVDTESGSFFETDELTQKLIENRNSPGSANAAGEFSRYTSEELREAERDINALVRENILFSSAPEHAVAPEFGGEVKSICLNISHKCNLACSYCFADGGGYGGTGAHMPLSVAKAAIDFLIAQSGKRHNLEVDFFGGEPLLNFEVVKDTVAYARSLEKQCDKNFLFTLTTNALLLTDEVTAFLNREADNVVVSIDGREHVHNSVRKTPGGADSFDIALKNALRFRKQRGDKKYYVRGTFTANNPDFARDVFALFDYGFDQVSVEPVVLPDNHPLAIHKSDTERLCAEYERLAEAYIERRAQGDWINFFHFNVDIYNGPCFSKRVKACGAGCEYLAVTPDGGLYPCHQFVSKPAFLVGNVLTGHYDKDIPLRFSSVNHIFAKPACTECWAKYYCSGGCAANAMNFYGKLTESHQQSCALMRKRIECALAIAAIESE